MLVIRVRKQSCKGVIQSILTAKSTEMVATIFVCVCGCVRACVCVHYYKAPTLFNNPVSSPLSESLVSPPDGQSLHPPTNVPPIQMAGTDVRPTKSAITARMALPSGSLSNSTTVYFILVESNNSLALTQKGQVVKLSMRTGLSSIKPWMRAWTAA